MILNRWFLLLIVFVTVNSYAQLSSLQIGGEASAGISILGVKSQFNDGSAFKKYVNPISYSLTAIADYPITEEIKLSAGLGITSKTISLTYTKGTDSTYQILAKAFNKKLNYNATYLRIPIVGKYYYDLFDDPNMTPYGQLGFVTDVQLNNAHPGGNGIDHSIDFTYHKRLDFSTALGAGLEIKTRENNFLYMSIMVYKGWLNSVTDSYGPGKSLIALRNNQVLFSIGLRFGEVFH